ncbi:conserved hypothetical protein [Nautilia profundicola AmH]|uniref:Uncharacterized protein n=1 Tax=Nautilia profundicola (strain ATCC BAA-1463 / DSM 18972 / AmH) TaxID=598659 RepID=B9L977_NAUPA|nr:hypothetical protein [Nautilia profundicola]ACM92393.1 conserved hypothetical protein [Nautilia profundicola AmH]
MNKFFILFFPLFLFAEFWNFPHTIELKKDETINFDVYYLKKVYPLKLRWTLFINDILTVLYRYDDFPRQITLYKDPPLNTFKIPIAKIPEKYPYFYIEFKDFNGKIATFDIYLKNGAGVKVDYKGKK